MRLKLYLVVIFVVLNVVVVVGLFVRGGESVRRGYVVEGWWGVGEIGGLGGNGKLGGFWFDGFGFGWFGWGGIGNLLRILLLLSVMKLFRFGFFRIVLFFVIGLVCWRVERLFVLCGFFLSWLEVCFLKIWIFCDCLRGLIRLSLVW